MWSFYLASSYYQIYSSSQTDNTPDTKEDFEFDSDSFFGRIFESIYAILTSDNVSRVVELVSIISAMLTGLILSMIRINEPYFKFLIKKYWKQCFGELMDEQSANNS